MAAFQIDFSIVQSNDCKTLTFTDTSNFSANDEGYVFSTFTTKLITVYDQDNNIIGTPINISSTSSVTFGLDKDRWLHIVYTMTNGSITPTPKIKNLLLNCNAEIKYGEAIVDGDCGCGCDKREVDPCKVLKALKAADIFARRGNSIKAQDSIDLANEYLDCNKGC